MNTEQIKRYFMYLDNNPLLFTNTLLNIFFEDGNKIVNKGFSEAKVFMLEELFFCYNNHYPGHKGDFSECKYINEDKQQLIIENYTGDFPLVLLQLYLLDVEDELIPHCITNLDIVYRMIQETFNVRAEVEVPSNYELNPMTKLMITSMLNDLRK